MWSLLLLGVVLLLYNFNTTFVHVEHMADAETTTVKNAFQYNICTCGAVLKWRLVVILYYFNTTFVHVELTKEHSDSLFLENFNTTFVHVEPCAQDSKVSPQGFQYNICTCGAMYLIYKAIYKNGFQYNICTCGACL